ncbi:MAG TPA: hypothetical protein PKC29_07770 [Thermodesulfobacteriota bacterium]|nr:hypothetical protein [Thermodesulfobacteriota bacterium]
MISKLRFSLIAVIMLVLFGFGFQNEAKGQLGTDNQFCPFIPNTTGWLDIGISGSERDFSAGLIGTVEGSAVGAVGGMDWMHVDFTNFDQPFPTNMYGAQAVSWWTQAEGRTTVLQVTNAFNEFAVVHVRILGADCQELTNFCDFYTGGDTHAYDFSDLITNDGVEPNDGVLQGKEGFVVVTAVDECPSSDVAVDYNGLAATTYVVDSDGYEYGMNAYHRAAVCFDLDEPATANLIDNGSFETGPGSVPEWFQVQGDSSVVEASDISPAVNPPLCDDPEDPECDAPNANRFMAFVGSSAATETSYYGQSTNVGLGSITSLVAASFGTPEDLIDTGVVETNVSVLESNIFTPGDLQNGSTNGTVSYQLSLLTDADECDQYAMVCTIDVTNFPTSAEFEDCNCYSFTGNGTAPVSLESCQQLSNQNTTGVDAPGLPAYNFATRSGFVTGTLSAPQDALLGLSYVVQVITGEKEDCVQDGGTVGAFADNFRIIEAFDLTLDCDFILTGAENSFLTSFTPTAMAGQFNVLPGNEAGAGADVVLINFADQYEPSYRPVPAFVAVTAGIWDEFEVFNSCGDTQACYLRLGIDENVIISDDFTPSGPTTTPTTGPTTGPTTPPTLTPPTTTPPTTSPTNRPGGGGGSCAIAGAPVQLGTAMANVLIPLVPVAFAFGVRRLRRKKK